MSNFFLSSLYVTYIRPHIKQLLPEFLRKNIRNFFRSAKKRRLEFLQSKLELALSRHSSAYTVRDLQEIIGAIDTRHIDQVRSYFQAFLVALQSVRKTPQDSSESSDRKVFLSMTQVTDASLISSLGWINLFYLSFRNKLIRESFFLRQKAQERAYIDADNNPQDAVLVTKAFAAAIDAGSFENAMVYLKHLQKNNLDKGNLKKLESYYLLHTGDSKAVERIWSSEILEEEDGFSDFIKGKKIAIVGPVPSGEKSGPEIDSFDIVVRINYLGPESMPGVEDFGKKTHVVYYNAEHSERIYQLNEHRFLAGPRYAMFPSGRFLFQRDLIKHGRGRVFRKNEYFFNGINNMVQNIVYDLVVYGPSRIKIFHTNFYLSKKLYHSAYTSSHELSFPVLAEHDLLSQLHFIRNLWRSGVVEVDDTCASVLRLSSEEYMSQIDEIHCHKTSYLS